MIWRRAAVIFLAGAALWLASASASAAEDEAEGRRRFKRGSELYQAGRFDDAAKEFEAAFGALPKAGLALSTAQSYQKAGQSRKALRFYKLFLTLNPESDKRPRIEEIIAELEAAVANEATRPSPALPPRAPAVPATPPKAAQRSPTPPPTEPTAPPLPPTPPPTQPRAPKAAPAAAPAQAPGDDEPGDVKPRPTGRPAPTASQPSAREVPAAVEQAVDEPELDAAKILGLEPKPQPPPPPVVSRPRPVEEPRAPPRPLTSRWWFWTVLGTVAVGGGVAAAVVLWPPGPLACGSLGCRHE